MRQLKHFALICVALCSLAPMWGQTLDFSGVYVRTTTGGEKSSAGFSPSQPLILQIDEHENSLELIASLNGSSASAHYILGGTSHNTLPDGTRTTDRATLKNGALHIESSIPLASGVGKAEIKEEYELSASAKILKVERSSMPSTRA